MGISVTETNTVCRSRPYGGQICETSKKSYFETQGGRKVGVGSSIREEKTVCKTNDLGVTRCKTIEPRVNSCHQKAPAKCRSAYSEYFGQRVRVGRAASLKIEDKKAAATAFTVLGLVCLFSVIF